MVIKQHMVAGRMVFREINAPLEHIGVHGTGCTFMLAGDYLYPVAPAESVVETHALEGIRLARAGARKACQVVFANSIYDLEDAMLFHVTAQHSWESCVGRMMAEGSVGREAGIEGERWVEGNDDVKVVAAGGYQAAHRYYAVVEADDYNSVVLLFNGSMWRGDVEILPVNDMIARRKASGNWGK
ncbi:MAG: hypothetical protein QF925_06685 [Dehalococcoidia bacterium]|nr:hypothetical protein [Dehalococcoidia bacterium]